MQPAVDVGPRRQSLAENVGPAEVDSWTVVYDREGDPETGLVAVLTADGSRAFARTTDPDDLARLATDACEGNKVNVHAEGVLGFLE